MFENTLIGDIINRFSFRMIHIYDMLTCKKVKASVGDIILQRNEIEHCQFLLSSRFLDIVNYCNHKDETFIRQNIISKLCYGKYHREQGANKAFKKLIDSYKEHGYQSNSFLSVDTDFRLLDGNHRMGANLYFKINCINVKVLKRKSQNPSNTDWYFKKKLEPQLYREINNGYQLIQQWLIESGNTFVAVFWGTKVGEILSDFKAMVTVLAEKSIYSKEKKKPGILVQFSLISPQYYVQDHNLRSKRIDEIRRIIIIRKELYDTQIDWIISDNCLIGFQLYNQYLS